jgi:O-antigen/teichoic acid export membrane protein
MTAPHEPPGAAASRVEDASADVIEDVDGAHDEVRHFRGSTILLFGRFIGIALDLVTQVLLVRALTKSEFGAFTFGLTIASMASTVALLGFDKTVSRFVPMYEERGDGRRLAGSLVLAFGIVSGVCIAMLLVALGIQATIGERLIENELARELVLILFFLTPVRAFDSLMTSCFTIFASPRAIVIRRNVLGPGLQLAAVVAVLVTDQPPAVLAVGYVIAGLLGIGLFAVLLFRLLDERGVIERLRRGDISLPIRSLFGFGLPLLSSDVVLLLRTSMVVVLLQYIATSVAVASYQAVLPLARQNLLIYQTFGFLFVPVASRFFARGQHERLREMYWQTSAWIAVATFPALALSVALAQPVTTFLFTDAYADSAIVLAVLSVGHYISAALGFNALTLRVQGSVRFIVTVDVLSAIVSLGSSVILIREFGALGAGIAISATLIVQNLLYQAGLVRTAIGLPNAAQWWAFGSVGVGIVALIAFQLVLQPPLVVGVVVAGLVSLALVGVNRHALQVGLYFPELMRIPVVRLLFGSGRPVKEIDAS